MSAEKNLQLFQKNSNADWIIGLPASSEEVEAILVFGGDGTIHRHLAELVKLQLPVLVVPCGSGNDFARALNLRSTKDSIAAWRKFLGCGSTRTIDLGLITPQSKPHGLKPPLENRSIGTAEAVPSAVQLEEGKTSMRGGEAPAPYDASRYPLLGSRYFCCVASVGLDADVARRANGLPRWLRGNGGYVLGLIASLTHFAPLPIRIQVQDKAGWSVRSDKPTILAAFANTPTYGGGMKIAPRAKPDDGQLEACLVKDMDKFKLFCLFPTVYFGRHAGRPEVEIFRVELARIETEYPLDVFADGEYVCPTPAEVSIARAALKVITP